MNIKALVKNNSKINTVASYIYTKVLGLNIQRISRGTKVVYKNAYLRKTRIASKGNNNSICFGEYSHIVNSKIYINGNNNTIEVGKCVSSVELDIVVDGDNNRVIIGDNTIISGKTHLACIEGTDIEIGADCLLSANITMRTGDSHSITDLNGNRINPSKSISIDNHVWIGNSVTILKGVSVRTNSIIGTGSVVTKSPEEVNCVLVGNPATVKKRDVNWDKARL